MSLAFLKLRKIRFLYMTAYSSDLLKIHATWEWYTWSSLPLVTWKLNESITDFLSLIKNIYWLAHWGSKAKWNIVIPGLIEHNINQQRIYN
jgi:hypothetical protein